MTSVSKNMSIDKLNKIVNKHNNSYHNTIKIKPVDIRSSIYIDFNQNNNKEDSNFKVGGNVRISKCKSNLQKVCSKLVWRGFSIKKVKNRNRFWW